MADEPARPAPSRLEGSHRAAAADAHASDQRASMVAGVATLAATLSTAGADQILDGDKLTDPSWIRTGFGIVLIASVICFFLAAAAALSTHLARWPQHGDLTKEPDAWLAETEERLRAGLRDHWRAANVKHRWAALALGLLVAGLFLIVILTVVAALANPT
jgi:hypothetical protein